MLGRKGTLFRVDVQEFFSGMYVAKRTREK